MIKPSIGRVVWYRPKDYPVSAQPLAALVVFVWNDSMVNLVVFDQNGMGKPKLSITLRQDGDEIPNESYCEWMPYQIGQAAKTAELETKLASA
jgi:hypothetical protein